MEELKIEIQTYGFVKEASYAHYFYSILQNYKNDFIGAEKLIVNIEEEVGGVVNIPSKYKPINISEDRKIVMIKVKAHKFISNKNKIIYDTPNEVFEKLRNTLERAKVEYKESENQNEI
jgi:hypothetical protein